MAVETESFEVVSAKPILVVGAAVPEKGIEPYYLPDGQEVAHYPAAISVDHLVLETLHCFIPILSYTYYVSCCSNAFTFVFLNTNCMFYILSTLEFA